MWLKKGLCADIVKIPISSITCRFLTKYTAVMWHMQSNNLHIHGYKICNKNKNKNESTCLNHNICIISHFCFELTQKAESMMQQCLKIHICWKKWKGMLLFPLVRLCACMETRHIHSGSTCSSHSGKSHSLLAVLCAHLSSGFLGTLLVHSNFLTLISRL